MERWAWVRRMIDELEQQLKDQQQIATTERDNAVALEARLAAAEAAQRDAEERVRVADELLRRTHGDLYICNPPLAHDVRCWLERAAIAPATPAGEGREYDSAGNCPEE
jgi:hypothetical protein